MAGEMEDFLRRAAQRRAENAAARADRAQPPRRPQYTDRDRERVSTSSDADDDIVIADLVQAQSVEDLQERQQRKPPQTGERRESEEAIRRKLQVVQGQPKQSQPKQSQPKQSQSSFTQSNLGQGGGMLGDMQRTADEAAAVPASSPALQALLRLMTDPNGIDQAILAHEILDRPTHRWR